MNEESSIPFVNENFADSGRPVSCTFTADYDAIKRDVIKARAKRMKRQMTNTQFVLALLIAPAAMAFSLYVWIEFVKLCVWLGQWTWP